MSSLDLIIKNGTLVSSKGRQTADIGVFSGEIVKIGKIEEEAKNIIDATGMLVLPGLIDSQVHFRDPGLTHKETIYTGSKAAVLGGICTFFEMPNTQPSTTTLKRFVDKLNIAKEDSFANYGFYMGATAKNLDEILKVENLEGCCGVKIFLGSSTGDLLLYNRDKLLEIFKTVSCPIAVHSENEERLKERINIRDNAKDVHAHYEWRDAQTALESTRMIIDVAKEAGRKVHVLHITTKEEIEFLANNKEHCTIEVTPQHLTLSAPEVYDRIGTLAQMNPPIRTKEHQDALWKALNDGVVDVLGSDHAPHTLEEKSKPYPASPSGMPGVQTIFPVMIKNMNEGKITLEKIIELMSENPARLWGLNKGKIEIGLDADFTLFDPNKEWTITNDQQASKVGWTPFYGMSMKGAPVGTIVMGQIAMLTGSSFKVEGQPIKRDMHD
jgi:dihydroorotase